MGASLYRLESLASGISSLRRRFCNSLTRRRRPCSEGVAAQPTLNQCRFGANRLFEWARVTSIMARMTVVVRQQFPCSLFLATIIQIAAALTCGPIGATPPIYRLHYLLQSGAHSSAGVVLDFGSGGYNTQAAITSILHTQQLDPHSTPRSTPQQQPNSVAQQKRNQRTPEHYEKKKVQAYVTVQAQKVDQSHGEVKHLEVQISVDQLASKHVFLRWIKSVHRIATVPR